MVSRSLELRPSRAGLSPGERISSSSDIVLLELESGWHRGHIPLGLLALLLEVGDVRCHFPAAFFDVVDATGGGALFTAVEQGGFLADQALVEGIKAGLVESAPAERIAGFDDFIKAPAFSLALNNAIADSEVAAHDLKESG